MKMKLAVLAVLIVSVLGLSGCFEAPGYDYGPSGYYGYESGYYPLYGNYSYGWPYHRDWDGWHDRGGWAMHHDWDHDHWDHDDWGRANWGRAFAANRFGGFHGRFNVANAGGFHGFHGGGFHGFHGGGFGHR